MAFVLALRAHALTTADAVADAREGALAEVERETQRLLELRAREDVVASARRPPQDVIALVNAALREAGIPADRFKNLEPESDVPTGNGLRRQTLRLLLEQVSLPQLGQFLQQWRARQGLWTPTSVELTHRLAGGAAADQAEKDDRFDVRVVVAATYFPDAKEAAK
jgi:hypothetical protein